MEAGGSGGFEKGRPYTRGEIHAVLGGSRRAALPTRGGRVVGLCLTRERNPRAPDEVVIGGNERSARLARDLAGPRAAVPVFVRAGGGWEYAGQRRVHAVVEEPGALLALLAEGAPPDATMALLLEEVPAESVSASPAIAKMTTAAAGA